MFVHGLPEIAAAQHQIRRTGVLSALSHHAWLLALLGLATFYGLERPARLRAPRDVARGPSAPAPPATPRCC